MNKKRNKISKNKVSTKTKLVLKKKNNEEKVKSDPNRLLGSDPYFMENLSKELEKREIEAFRNSLEVGIEESFQMNVLQKKMSELNLLKNNEIKFHDTIEYKKCKQEFYYDTVSQIVNLRLKIVEEIKQKYGNDIAKEFLTDIRREVKNIWSNCANDIEIEEKTKEIEREEKVLKEIRDKKENGLQEIPKISSENIIEKPCVCEEPIEIGDAIVINRTEPEFISDILQDNSSTDILQDNSST